MSRAPRLNQEPSYRRPVRERRDDSWKVWARCRVLPPRIADEMFFNVDVRDPLKYERETLYCGPCPVKEECLAYGEQVSPSYGTWGGVHFGRRNANKRYYGKELEMPEGAEDLESRGVR